MPRQLIVNADDFGFTRDVNAGIVEAHQDGILRATTLMANGAAFDDAVERIAETPGLDVGVHLVLIGGNSVAEPGRELPRKPPQFLARLAAGWSPTEIEEEFCAQIEKVRAAGIEPSHLDTHKHTHLAPRVLDAMVSAARRYEIGWIRRPLGRLYGSKIETAGLRMTDSFLGFRETGRLGEAELAKLIAGLREGSAELMTHPGRCGPELLEAPTRLKQSREVELRALTSKNVIRTVEALRIDLVSYRDI